MKKRNIFTGLFVLFVVSILGIGATFAHGEYSTNNKDSQVYSRMGYGMMGNYNGYSMMGNINNMYEMHDEMTDLFVNGTYEDLEDFRNEYNMPAMYWIDDQEDLDNFKENQLNMGSYTGMGYSMMR